MFHLFSKYCTYHSGLTLITVGAIGREWRAFKVLTGGEGAPSENFAGGRRSFALRQWRAYCVSSILKFVKKKKVSIDISIENVHVCWYAYNLLVFNGHTNKIKQTLKFR